MSPFPSFLLGIYRSVMLYLVRMPEPMGALPNPWAIPQIPMVESLGGKCGDFWVHAVLGVQHDDWPIVRLQPLEQGDIIEERDSSFADYGCRQLHRVSYQIHLQLGFSGYRCAQMTFMILCRILYLERKPLALSSEKQLYCV